MVKLGNLSLSLRSLSLDHETEDGDTIASINKYLEDNIEEYRRFRQLGQSIVGEDADIPEKLEIGEETAAAPVQAEQPKKRGRKSKNQPDPATAVAPAPIPVPDAAPVAPAAPVDTAPNANGIPAFLDRAAAPAAPPAPAAPVATMAPPPPPGAPAAPKPPVGTLAPKIVAELRTRATGTPDGGAGLVAWLAGAALVVPNATFEEALECLQFLTDEKLAPVATALGIS